jgi:signal transduction histidine kinase
LTDRPLPTGYDQEYHLQPLIPTVGVKAVVPEETRPAWSREHNLFRSSGWGDLGLPSGEGPKPLSEYIMEGISSPLRLIEDALTVNQNLLRASELFFGEAQKLTPCQIASIYSLNEPADEITAILFGTDLSLPTELGRTFPLAGSWIEQHLHSGLPRIESTEGAQDCSFVNPRYLDSGIKSSLWAPLTNQGRFLGVIALHSQNPHAFDDKIIAEVSDLGCRLVPSVESAARYLRALQQEKFVQALSRTSRALTSTLDVQQVLETICRECCTVLEVDYSILHEVRDEDLVCCAAWPAGASQTYSHASHRSVNGQATNIPARVALARQPEVINEALNDTDLPKQDGFSGVTNVHATMWVPLIARGRVMGVLELAHVGTGRQFTRCCLQIAEAFASSAAIALDNAQLNEEAHRHSESHQRALLQAIPDAIFRLRKDGTFLSYIAPDDCQPSVLSEQILGRNIESVMPAEAAKLAMDRLAKALSSYQVQTFEYQLPVNDQARDYEARIVANGPEEVLAVVRDVTERKSLEAQFFQAQKMELLGRLASGISHDFNNLLGGIMGYASLLKGKLGSESEAHEYASIIENATKRGAELTQQLLAAVRRSRFNSRPMNINEITEEVVQIFSRTLSRDIRMASHLQPELPLVPGDQSQIHQLLMNLCINAADAMPDGGVLTLSTEKVHLDEELCRRQHMPSEPGQYVQLTISDTGIGISEVDLPKIFDPFFTTKEPGKGTGLGLAVVYAIVKNHNGTIEVSSVPGEGSSFTVYLPVYNDG